MALGIRAGYLIQKISEVAPSGSAASPLPIQTSEASSSFATEAPLLNQGSSISLRLNGPEFTDMVRSGALQVFVEIADSEESQPVRMRLVPERNSRPQASRPHSEGVAPVEVDDRTRKLLGAAYHTAGINTSHDWINLADFGNAIKRLEPTFKPEVYGERSLGSLLRRMSDMFELRADEANPIVFFVRLKPAAPPPSATHARHSSPVGLSKLTTGKIHNLKLGFGFIAPDDGSENLFFHATEVIPCISKLLVRTAGFQPAAACSGDAARRFQRVTPIRPAADCKSALRRRRRCRPNFHRQLRDAPEVIGCTTFDLRPGDSVQYEAAVNEKGPCARKVHRLTTTAASPSGDDESSRSGELTLLGRLHSYANAKEAMLILLRELAMRDPGFLKRCSEHPKVQGRKRRYIARSPEELYPDREDLRDMRESLPGGWLVATNLSNALKMTVVRIAAESAGLHWGRDIVVDF